MVDDFLKIEGSSAVIDDFVLLSEILQNTHKTTSLWKWALICLHNGLQGLMVLALQGSNGLKTLRPEDLIKWHEAIENGTKPPANLKLDDFLNLYKKIKSDKMLQNINSKQFKPNGTQGGAIKQLNRLRNEFIHFTPKLWYLELEGLPHIATDCLDVAEFLAWESGNVYLFNRELIEKLKTAFSSIRKSLDLLCEKTAG